MNCESNRSNAPGLERSCEKAGDWVRASGPIGGIERLEAWFAGHAYAKHRHDSYVIGVTESGVQAFDYRGMALCSLPGEVLVLHPDETHDGRAADDTGFGYRALYVEPARIAEATQAILDRPCALPFVRRAVSDDSGLARTIRTAFRCDLEPLALDALILRLTEGLIAADASLRIDLPPARIDLPALERARAFLEAETGRVVRSSELEALTGHSRYGLARQFRLRYGTSPYRYALMRRLDFARARIARKRPLAETALDAGFADQAHLTRVFKAAYGITPARYGALHRWPH